LNNFLRPSVRAEAIRRLRVTLFVTLAVFVSGAPAAANDELMRRGLEIEGQVQGFPRRSAMELAGLLSRAETAPSPERRFVVGLYGQASVLAGDGTAAAELADRLEGDPKAATDPAQRAIGLLIRSAMESSGGDSGKAVALARRARELASRSDDDFVKYWSALAVGTLTRTRGQTDEALASLHDAMTHAEAGDHPYRRSSALYQLAVLHRVLKNAPESLAASLAAYQDAELARSAYAMTNAKIAESAVMELLDRPVQELAAMEQALAIARRARSEMAEARALINLADIRLRRNQFGAALDLSRRALVLAQAFGDAYLAATTKANM
jgi:hypothetical protein